MVNQDNTVDDTTINVARQIRTMRERRNLSQRALADESGLSRNTLSLLERGHTSPTVSTLKRLAVALGVDINAFFNSQEDESVIYTKSRQRLNLQLDQALMADLGSGMLAPLMTPLILQINPGARSGPALSHEGQDFIYCISGEILYSVNGRAFVLEPGDSLLFDGNLQHRFQSTADSISEILIILSTPRESNDYILGHFPDDQNNKEKDQAV